VKFSRLTERANEELVLRLCDVDDYVRYRQRVDSLAAAHDQETAARELVQSETDNTLTVRRKTAKSKVCSPRKPRRMPQTEFVGRDSQSL
jgi:hypothetical protein